MLANCIHSFSHSSLFLLIIIDLFELVLLYKYKLFKGGILDKIRELIKKCILGTEFDGKTYLVGGYVRDLVMDKGHLSNDMDIVVAIPNGGVLLSQYLYEKGVSSEPVIFESFGTSMIQINGYSIEFVMARKESYRDKSRKPDVEAGTIEDDIYRRDFTINSLLQEVVSGEIIDISGYGYSDIEEGIIRSTSDPGIIFVEDPLRILRAIRFAARFNYKIESNTEFGMKEHVDKLEYISKERIKDELTKILIGDNVGYGLNLLQDTGVMKYILPDLVNLRNLEQNKYHFGDVWNHTVVVVENTPIDLETRMGALLHDVGKYKSRTEDSKGIHFYKHESYSAEIAFEMLTNLRYSKQFIVNVCNLIKNHMKFKNSGYLAENLTNKTLRKIYYHIGDLIDKLLDLVHADNVSHATDFNMPRQVEFIRKRLDKIKEEYNDTPFPLSGHDIMNTFEISEGELIGEFLKQAREIWLEHPDISKEKLLRELEKKK